MAPGSGFRAIGPEVDPFRDLLRTGLIERRGRASPVHRPHVEETTMSDHLHSPGPIAIQFGDDTASIGPPMGDPTTAITDVYAFLNPGDSNPRKSILVLNVNPLAPLLAGSFGSHAVYEFNIDTNGDAVADRSFRITFSELAQGAQTATVR